MIGRAWCAALLAIDVLVAAGCASSAGARGGLANAGDVLVALRQIADDRVLARDDFYTRGEQTRRFGDVPQIKLDESKGAECSASVSGYGRWADLPPRAPIPNGIFIGFYRYLARSGAKRGTLVCFMKGDFRGFSSGLDFDSVVARLGPGWRRDTQAEQERFFAIAREPFNPPIPTPTAPMGGAIVMYGQGETQVELDFNGTGVLGSIETSRFPC